MRYIAIAANQIAARLAFFRVHVATHALGEYHDSATDTER